LTSAHVEAPATVVLQMQNVSRTYRDGPEPVWALRDVFLEVASGEAVAVMGPSGSGKTTLLNVAAGTDLATAGSVRVLGHDLAALNEGERTALRARSVGIVFQDPHLLPGLTALENVAVAKLPWRSWRDLADESRTLLEAVGMGHRLDFPPARLSGGERQRVGIARALLGTPRLILADEPTGNLDAGSTEAVLALLSGLQSELGFALILVTHDPAVAAVGQRVVRMHDGSLGEGDLRA
jgi:putative ABC transport system ATP-binding protein